jgi:hypothetical protein
VAILTGKEWGLATLYWALTDMADAWLLAASTTVTRADKRKNVAGLTYLGLPLAPQFRSEFSDRDRVDRNSSTLMKKAP